MHLKTSSLQRLHSQVSQASPVFVHFNLQTPLLTHSTFIPCLALLTELQSSVLISLNELYSFLKFAIKIEAVAHSP